MKKTLLILLIALLAGAFYIETTQGLMNFGPTRNIMNYLNVNERQIEEISEEGISQVETLIERGSVLSEQTSKVLGSSIQVNEEDEKRLHEKAMEHAKYLYCKSVIEQYEKISPEPKEE